MGHKKRTQTEKSTCSHICSRICEPHGARAFHDPYLRHNPLIVILIQLEIRLNPCLNVVFKIFDLKKSIVFFFKVELDPEGSKVY